MSKNSTLKLGRRGIALIKAFESYVGYPYDDAYGMVKGKYREWKGGVRKGEITIGYGHTDAAGLPKVVPGMRMTEEEASLLLDVDLDGVEADVRRVVLWPLEQYQFDAICSFHFNCYGLILEKGNLSLCCKALNRGDFDAAMQHLQRWNHQNGQVKRGLVRRRAAERALFEGRFEDAETLMQG